MGLPMLPSPMNPTFMAGPNAFRRWSEIARYGDLDDFEIVGVLHEFMGDAGRLVPRVARGHLDLAHVRKVDARPSLSR